MKLKLYGFENELEIKSGINILSILNKKLYNQFVYLLSNNPIDNGMFDFIDDEFKKLDFAKIGELVSNPYCLNVNDKKYLSALYKELNMSLIADESRYLEVVNLVGRLEKQIEEVSIDMEFDVDTSQNLQDLFKYLGIRLVSNAKNLLDNLFEYVDIYSRWFPSQVLAFVNICIVLTKTEIEELDKYAKYNNVKLLMIENVELKNVKVNQLIILKDFSDIVV